MNCPKCNQQNPDDAQVCTSCGSDLTQPHTTGESVQVKTSRLAIASLIFGILTLFAFPFFLVPGFNSFVWPIIVIVAAKLAIIIGIIALVRIGLSAGRLTGKGLASIGTAIPVVLFSIIFLNVLLHSLGCIAFRMVCSSNLAQIGRAMLVYNSGYDDPLPQAGGPGTIWQPKINDWRGRDRISAFNLKPDGTGGSATISSSLYLLVKYGEQDPRLFVCPKDTGTTEFKPAEYGALEKDIEKFWDFGPEPSKHCSVSYHLPYGPYPLNTATGLPRTAVIADRNPWLHSPAAKAADFRVFDPNGDTTAQMAGNSIPHKRDGQNVLFMDFHVAFEKRAFCGVNDDNIYTYWDGTDIRRGAPPTLTSHPKDPLDSLLVNDPPTDRK
ncbi:MAG TPA: zinc-ribbon domain-containing protein [Sedimentisphaerales bacterium]|nr:zinc-ribbon domain-containing protein [Sedimentisphaerales bacterium]